MLGPLPAEVQSYIVMVGGVASATKQNAVATDLVRFFTAPSALPVLKKKGMDRP